MAASPFYTQIHPAKRYRLGATKRVNGNEFVYCQGVASLALGDWVTFTSAGVTTRYVANGKGRVGVAMSANTSTTNYSWFQIFGQASANAAASYASGGKVWATATAGVVDDADVAVDLVVGAIGRSTIVGAGLAVFDLNYPFAHNEVLN